jgi:hypothetical protein
MLKGERLWGRKMENIDESLRKKKTAWNGEIKDMETNLNEDNRTVSERIEGLNTAIRQAKRILRK